MVSHFTAMVSFLSETIWNQMKPYHFYHLLPNENCLCGSSLFLSGYETDERSSLGRSGAPLPAADAGEPLRWRNKEHCEAAASKATIFLKGKQGEALWEEPGAKELQAPPPQSTSTTEKDIEAPRKPQWLPSFSCRSLRWNSKDIISPNRPLGRTWTKFIGF